MIYLDHAATTPVDRQVLQQMLPYFCDAYANASSKHRSGKGAAAVVQDARTSLAHHLGVQPHEIIFTGGASEANNLALKGVANCDCYRGHKLHFISSAIEHKSVIETLKCLAKDGHDVTFVPVDSNGVVDLDVLARSIRPNTVLVSIMHVNNETGAVQPLAEIAEICDQYNLIFHTDATQSFGKLPIDAEREGVNLLSASGHKLYGPKGVGLLLSSDQTPMSCQISGGSQEGGMRAGTLNVPGIVGLGAAANKACANIPQHFERMQGLRSRFLDAIFTAIPGAYLNGSIATSVPWIMNISFEGVNGHALRDSLDKICVSCSSACAKSNDPSHVLDAMRIEPSISSCAIRISPGRLTTQDEMDEAAVSIAANVARLRASR